MKRNKLIPLGCMLLCLAFAQVGCAGGKDAAESWAYIHDPEVEVFRLENDGKAVYKGNTYEYSKDEQFFTLTDEQGNVLKMRYTEDKDGMLLYETTTYQYAGEGEADGLIGLWENESQHWSYEFTVKGTFLEDGVFPGYYILDEEAGTIKLIYNDHFEDTYVYYSIEDGELTVEYPWPMVKME